MSVEGNYPMVVKDNKYIQDTFSFFACTYLITGKFIQCFERNRSMSLLKFWKK